ncbi:MAG: hypothetical protein P8M25_13940, partial [Paracoccaceae bacterium]|nr:hypothetical protein [Paracoccaceae bacterium]
TSEVSLVDIWISNDLKMNAFARSCGLRLSLHTVMFKNTPASITSTNTPAAPILDCPKWIDKFSFQIL